MFAIDARRKRDVDVWGNGDERQLTVRKISKHRKVLSATVVPTTTGPLTKVG